MHCILDHLFVFEYLILLEEFTFWPYSCHLSAVDLLSIIHWQAWVNYIYFNYN